MDRRRCQARFEKDCWHSRPNRKICPDEPFLVAETESFPKKAKPVEKLQEAAEAHGMVWVAREDK